MRPKTEMRPQLVVGLRTANRMIEHDVAFRPVAGAHPGAVGARLRAEVLSPAEPKGWPRLAAIVLGAAVSALGLEVLVGWYLRVPAMLRLRPGAMPVAANTAVCLVVLGLGVVAASWERRRTAGLAGVFVLALATAEGLQYLFHVNLGIDQALVRDFLASSSAQPGRVAPNTAVALAVAGAGLAALLGRSDRREVIGLGTGGALLFIMGVVPVLGYATGIPGAYDWGMGTRMAPLTAVGVFLLGLGLLMAAWSEARVQSPKSLPWLPVVGGAAVWSSSFWIWAALRAETNSGSRGPIEIVLGSGLLLGAVVALLIHANQVAHRHAVSAAYDRDVSERLLQSLSDMDEGVAVFDHDMIVYANEAMARLVGTSVPELLALPGTLPLIDPEHLAAFRDRLRQLEDGGRYARYQTVLRGPTGHRAEVELVTELLGGSDGNQRIAVVRDVGDRLAAERALQQSERKFRALIQHSTDAIFVIGPDGQEIFRSEAVERIYGYAPAVGLGSSMLNWVHPDDQTLVMEQFARLSADPGGTISDEIRIRHEDGTWRWFEITATNMLLEPAVNGFVFNTRDVTERKAAEADLLESEGRFRSVFTETGMAAALVSRQGSFLEVNDAYCRMHGYTREEMMRLELRDVVHPDDPVWEEHHADLTHVEIEQRHVRKDGSVIDVLLSVAAVREAGGRLDYLVAMLQDITARKRAEVEISKALEVEQEAVERLRALDELKNSFLTAVSHELRTPLSAVLGSALTLERSDIELSSVDREALTSAVASNARKLAALLTDLLDLDRLRRGILEPLREPVDLGALVERVVVASDAQATHPVTFDAQPLTILVDGSKIERILENLLVNAVRHTPRGTPIHVAVRAVAGGAELVVEDEGLGVPDQLRAAIFQPFDRGRAASTDVPGVGIGLSLVAKFSELHGGRAWVEDRVGGGASFHVFLPAKVLVASTDH